MAIVNSYWKTDVSGSFNVGANWSLGTVPNATTDAYVNATGAAYTVTSSVANQVDYLAVGASATFDITAGSFVVYSASNGYGKPQSGMTNNGVVAIGAGAHLVLGKSNSPTNDYSFLFNTGAINISSTGAAATLTADAPYNTLRGGGTITLSGAAQIIGGTTAGTFDNRDNTIAGSGVIGNANLTLQNDKLGIIDANGAKALVINTGANVIANSGSIETTGSGGLTIDSSINDQGSLEAGGTGALTLAKATVNGGGDVAASVAKSLIKLSTATIKVGGTVSTVAGSSIATVAGTTDELDTSDVENAGSIVVTNNSTLITNAYIENTGTFNLSGSSSKTTMEVGANGTSFQGTGKLVLSNSAENFIVSNGSEGQLTNRSTILGAGTIGDADLRFVNLVGAIVNASGSVGLTIIGDNASGENPDFNSGLVETTGSGGLTIAGAFNSSGTIAAAGVGALTLNGMTSTNNGGLIETTASGASITMENGASISGGTLTLAAGSSLTSAAGSNNSVLETVNNNGAIHIANGSTLTASDNHWNNTGTISLDGTSAATKWIIETPTSGYITTLVGKGTVDLANAVDSIVSNGSAAVLRNTNNLIEGTGTIGDANLTLQNQADGTINANLAGGLTINTGSNNVFNDGTIESNNANGLQIDSNLNNNGLLISNLGTIDVTGNVFNDGISQINDGGELEFGLADNNDVVFGAGSGGTLRLDHSSTAADTFNGTIEGFAGQDKIDLSDISYVAPGSASSTSLSYAGVQAGQLTVTDGTHTTTLGMVGPYTSGSFTLSSDQHNGTLVTLT